MQEEELLLHPQLFALLGHYYPKVSRVEVLLKRGGFDNEMSQFRYDAVIHVGEDAEVPAGGQWLDWAEQIGSVAALQARLSEERPALLQLKDVPNARLAVAAAAAQALARDGGLDRPWEAGLPPVGAGAHPEDIWRLEASLPYRFELSWRRGAADGGFDVICRRADAPAAVAAWPDGPAPIDGPPGLALAAYANKPLLGKAGRRLIPQMRAFLSDTLPDYMLPGIFIALDALPLTAHGKVDRKALPVPGQATVPVHAYQPPRTPTEEALAKIWGEVLGLERVGVEDNFFELGGHSLLATQVVSRVRGAFGIELPLRTVFEAVTVADLAAEVDLAAWARERAGAALEPGLAEVEEGEL
jgi:acyl carrier protein